MNSTFKTCMCALALGLSGAVPLYAASATAACEQTHSILYAGADSQAIMKIKVTVTETSQILKGMTFSMAGTTSVSDMIGIVGKHVDSKSNPFHLGSFAGNACHCYRTICLHTRRTIGVDSK